MKSIFFSPADGRGKQHWKRGAAKTFAALSLLLLGSAVTAQTVSVDFVGGNGATTPSPMGPTEVAGAVPVANWNNAVGANAPGGTPMALVDSTGAASSLTVDWEGSPTTWSSAIPDAPGNNRMMVGYLDQGGNNPGPFTTTTVTVAGLNAATSYGVYVYASGDVPGRVGKYTLGAQTYYLTNSSTFDGSTFTQVTSTNVNAPGAGNYMLFTVSGQTSFTMSATPINFRSPVNAIQVVNLSVAPAAPTNLVALATNNLVSLNWAGSAGALTYNVYRGATAGGESATPLATGVNGASYRDTSAVNGATYYYTVKAVNNTGVSGASNEATATPVAAVTGNGAGLEGLYYTGDAGDYSSETGAVIFSYLSPTVNYDHGNGVTTFSPTDWPSGLIAANGGTSDHFTAVWSGTLLAPYTGPYVFQSNSDDGSQFSIDTGAGLQVQFTNNTIHGPTAFTSPALNLTAGHQYPIKLEYLNDTGGYTEQLIYNPVGLGFQIIPQTQLFPSFPAAPPAVTNLTALGGTKSVTLNWTGALYAVTYNIYRGTTPGGESATPIATGVTANTFTDTGLSNGVTYYYYIVAVNNVGSSPHSNEAFATPTNPFIGNGDGLYGTYYGGADTGYMAETGPPIGFGVVPTINFNAGNGGVANNPGPFPSSLPATNFTAVWTGLFLAPYTASYTFQINSDDGSRLSLGTDSTTGSLALVVDNTAFQGPTAKNTASISLIGGQKYSIEMEYFQGGGGATAQLLYSIAGSPFTIIPQTQLFSNVTTLPGQISNLSAVAYSNSVHLYWTSAPFAVTYNVYRGTTPGGESATPIATGINTNSYTDNTAVNGTTYYYTVSGVSGGGIGPASNEASATPVNTLSVVSFWRFEEGVAGMTVAPGVQLPDSSGHGNTLQTPDPNAAPTYSTNVPGSPTTPPLSNLLSVDFTAQAGTGFVGRELNTGGATGDINTHTFNQMTIEASFNVASIGGYQTFLGREGSNYPGDTTAGGDADLYFQLPDPGSTGGTQVVSIRAHETSDGAFVVCNGSTQLAANQWYNAAGVADGHSLSLYLQTTPNGAYHLENSVPFLGGVGNQGTRWIIGRGVFGGNPTDRYNGFADEIRISDNALAPSQFLFAPVAGATVTATIALEGVSDLSAVSPFSPLGTFHIVFRTVGTSTVIKTADVSLATAKGSANGTFSISGVPAGTYDVLIKGSKNLAVLVPGVAVTTTGTVGSGANPVLLPAGDSNGDNSVDSTDFGNLIGAFNTTGAVAGSGYDPTVDFNFDGSVDSTDFGLLIGEFNNVGAK